MARQADATREVITRLRRAEGQIRGVVAMLEAGRDCGDVVVQLAAVSRALDRAGFRLLASQLQQCLTARAAEEAQPSDGPADAADAPAGTGAAADLERLEKLFLSLA